MVFLSIGCKIIFRLFFDWYFGFEWRRGNISNPGSKCIKKMGSGRKNPGKISGGVPGRAEWFKKCIRALF